LDLRFGFLPQVQCNESSGKKQSHEFVEAKMGCVHTEHVTSAQSVRGVKRVWLIDSLPNVCEIDFIVIHLSL
jgi:hypothetical protein